MEIERKFLVIGEPWRQLAGGVAIRQGYLSQGSETTVRVRVTPGETVLTVKGPTRGISRVEFEYPIPAGEGEALLQLCHREIVEKTRYRWLEAEHCFEIDVFSGQNEGLVVAEIELGREDEVFARPSWLGGEVSHDPRYRNSELTLHPYSEWSD